jgi:hypothetical protein
MQLGDYYIQCRLDVTRALYWYRVAKRCGHSTAAGAIESLEEGVRDARM